MINFQHVLTGSLLHSLWNSVVLAVVSTAIASVTGVFAAYSLSRRRIPFKGPLLLFVLFSSGVPLAIMVIPVYEIFSRFNYLTILPTAIFLSVTSLPFEIYLMKNFIDAVPTDLEEAARIESASTFQVLRRVVVPLAMPGIAAASIFGFVNAWGSFVVPLILISPAEPAAGADRHLHVLDGAQARVRQHRGLLARVLRAGLHPLRHLRRGCSARDSCSVGASRADGSDNSRRGRATARLRVGVIGTGVIGQVMHLHFLRELADRYEIAAVCDVSAAKRRCGGPRLRRARRVHRLARDGGERPRRGPHPHLGQPRADRHRGGALGAPRLYRKADVLSRPPRRAR